MQPFNFPTPLAKETILFPLYILTSFIKNKITGGVCVYFWALCSVPLIHMAVFVPVPYCFQLLELCSNQKSGRIMPSALFFFFRIVLAIMDLLWFHMHFRICSSSLNYE